MLNIDRLRELKRKPRVHGNGFIQLDVDEFSRFHFWGHPGIPKQKVPTPIHDHIFGFYSIVLSGSVENREYKLVHPTSVRATYQIYEAVVRDKDDTELRLKDSTFVSKFMTECEIIEKGNHYSIKPFVFHETLPREISITFIQKRDIRKGKPRILVPSYTRPDNEFGRYGFSEDYLWEIIEEIIVLSRME